MNRLVWLALAFSLSAMPAGAEQKANKLFGALKTASNGAAQAIGSYAKGCAAGLVQLPESGPTWQAMRLSRDRNWGQPVLVDYLQDLSAQVQDAGWRGLYVGDMSQPRGGPMTSGHTSHQIGLDVDIWMLPPGRLDLSVAERENLSSISVRTADQTRVNENWTRGHAAVLRMAAQDKRVERVFVAAAIKIEMCKSATGADKTWLQKIRPIYGHDDHFHVRLKCPPGSPMCEVQTPSVAELSNGGNGCDDTLTWWVTTYLEELKNPPKPKPGQKATRKRGARDFTMDDLPRMCRKVLAAE